MMTILQIVHRSASVRATSIAGRQWLRPAHDASKFSTLLTSSTTNNTTDESAKRMNKTHTNITRSLSNHHYNFQPTLSESQQQQQLQLQYRKKESPMYFSTKSSTRVDDIFQKILQLDFVEVSLLGQLVYEKIGMNVSGNISLSAGSGGAGGKQDDKQEKAEEKTAFDLKLTGFDAKAKIKVIKEIRAITGLGLKDAKELVEGAPKVIKTNMKKEEAEELKAKLESIGATADIE